MKVLFDTQIFDWQISGGISRYFYEVISRLENNPLLNIEFKCCHSYNTYIQNSEWLKHNARFGEVHFRGKLRILKQFNQLINRRFVINQLQKEKKLILHPTYYDPYFLKNIGKHIFILTVHDLINEKLPDNSKLTKKILSWKKALIMRADHIISVSENTKNDIISYYHINPDKITTIHLAGNFKIAIENDLEPEIRDKDYILFVGSRSGYKNFINFVKETGSLINKYDLNLIIAGGGNLLPSEMSLLKGEKIYDKTIALPHVSDSVLMQLYSSAKIFVFPSLYEGFGIPVLEAMRCNCPVILSNNSSLPEVGGNAAAYFNPFIKGELKQVLEKLLIEDDRLFEMKIKGEQQSLKFDWNNTANEHAKVYNSFNN